MSNSCKNITANMQQVQESQDGTITGGFVSVTGGRYRVILDPYGGATSGAYVTNKFNCGRTHNGGCFNLDCPSSTNWRVNDSEHPHCVNSCCSPH